MPSHNTWHFTPFIFCLTKISINIFVASNECFWCLQLMRKETQHKPSAGWNTKPRVNLQHVCRFDPSKVTILASERSKPTRIKIRFMDAPVWLDDTGERWAQQPILSHPAFNRPLLPLDTRLVTKPTHVPHCQILKRLVSKITQILTVMLYMCKAYMKWYISAYICF